MPKDEARQQGRAPEASHRHDDRPEKYRAAGQPSTHRADFTDREVVAVVDKNRTDQVRIAFSRIEDTHLLDLRVYATFDGQEARPTRKGIMLRLTKLPALVEALQSALAEARRRGLLSAEGVR